MSKSCKFWRCIFFLHLGTAQCVLTLYQTVKKMHIKMKQSKIFSELEANYVISKRLCVFVAHETYKFTCELFHYLRQRIVVTNRFISTF